MPILFLGLTSDSIWCMDVVGCYIGVSNGRWGLIIFFLSAAFLVIVLILYLLRFRRFIFQSCLALKDKLTDYFFT